MDAAARRGMAGSGNALVGQLVGGQAAANQASNQATQAAALGEQARMGAIQGAGQMAGGIRTQDYQKAEAQDQIAKFNAQNNLMAQQYSAGNAFNRAQGMASELEAQARQKDQDADWTAKRWGGLGKTIGSAGDYAAKAFGWNIPGLG